MTEPNNLLLLRHPTTADGAAIWRLARDSRVLDVNSPYAYLLWCRDFATTSIIAVDDVPVGFATGYVRPDDPGTYLLWQIAVDTSARGRGIAGAMLDRVFAAVCAAHPAVTHLETTITADNLASRRLFTAFAERHDAPLATSALFTTDLFPDDSGEAHAAEDLHRIGPVRQRRNAV